MAQPIDRGRNDWDYRRLAEAVRAQGGLCLCGRVVDPRAPRHLPEAATADHVLPIARGGHLLGALVVMHRVCNMRKGTQVDTPELRARLAGLPLQWDTPPAGGRSPKHSQEW